MSERASTKLVIDPVVRRSVLEAVELGAFQSHAARAAGINPRTFEDWVAKGNGSKPDPSGEYTKFYEELEVARGKAVINNLKMLKDIALTPKGAHAITWLLGKLDPKHYGDRIEIKAEVEHRKIYSFEEPAIPIEGEIMATPRPKQLEGEDDD